MIFISYSTTQMKKKRRNIMKKSQQKYCFGNQGCIIFLLCAAFDHVSGPHHSNVVWWTQQFLTSLLQKVYCAVGQLPNSFAQSMISAF